jgi:hypothetical protein
MTQPFNPSGDGQPAVPAPDTTAAGSRAAGGIGPGVPLSIWPGLPDPSGARDGLPCGGPVTVAAAHRVIDTFSVPGDLVAAAGGCSPAVTEAAAAAGRRVLGLVLRPAPALHRPGGPAALPPPGDPAAGTAGLAVAGCCGPGCCGQPPGGAGGEPDPGPAFAACERALRPGGVLAVITAGTAVSGGTLTDTAGSVVAAARAAGLVYAQHIVLVRAAIDGDRLAPAAPDPSPGTAGPGGSPVHDDLLVFTKPGKPVSSAESGGPRP